MKPTSGLGKRTELLLGETVIGERQYYDSGILFEEKLYKDYPQRVLHGLHRTWHRNGKPWEERTYKDGLLHGRCRSRNANGKLLVESEMTAGTGILKAYHANGIPATECPYKDGKKHGNCRAWYKNGSLLEDTAYENGKFEGWSRCYHASGRPKSEAMFRDGKPHGVFRYWNEPGKLVNSYGLLAKDTPSEYENIEESPHYYANGRKVTHEQFEEESRSDATLRRFVKAGL